MGNLNPKVEVTEQTFPHGTWELEGVIFTVAPTWVMNPKRSFAKFQKDLQNKPVARRDFGCIPTAVDSSYLPNPELIEIKSNREREDSWDIANQTFRLDLFRPRQRDYFLHGDFSARKDSSGIAMCHYDEPLKKIIMDIMINLEVPQGGELILRRLQNLVYEIDRMGFRLYKVTYDGFQSIAFEQEFKRHGIRGEYFSVDKDTAPYDTLIELIDDDILDYYYQSIFIANMKNLRLVSKGKKIEHASGGSKDLSDAVAGCVYQCYLKMPKECRVRSVG